MLIFQKQNTKMARKYEVDKSLIEQYINITGTDDTIAKNMLEAFDGNLEMAVNMFLEGSVPNFNSGLGKDHDDDDDVVEEVVERKPVQQEGSSSSSSDHQENIIW